jgi:hypothetical protein
MTTLNVFIPARQLSAGDYIIGRGKVTAVRTRSDRLILVTIEGKFTIFAPDERVEVSLEDNGDE